MKQREQCNFPLVTPPSSRCHSSIPTSSPPPLARVLAAAPQSPTTSLIIKIVFVYFFSASLTFVSLNVLTQESLQRCHKLVTYFRHHLNLAEKILLGLSCFLALFMQKCPSRKMRVTLTEDKSRVVPFTPQQ